MFELQNQTLYDNSYIKFIFKIFERQCIPTLYITFDT